MGKKICHTLRLNSQPWCLSITCMQTVASGCDLDCSRTACKHEGGNTGDRKAFLCIYHVPHMRPTLNKQERNTNSAGFLCHHYQVKCHPDLKQGCLDGGLGHSVNQEYISAAFNRYCRLWGWSHIPSHSLGITRSPLSQGFVAFPHLQTLLGPAKLETMHPTCLIRTCKTPPWTVV